jgi:SPX domain protein involved in polyphosphate accumulation
MKFGKYILEYAVPEWKSKYINYKLLKEAIKVGKGTNLNSANSEILLIDRKEQGEELNEFGEFENIRPNDQEFVLAFKKEVAKAEEFYEEHCQNCTNKLNSVRIQCELLPEQQNEKDRPSKTPPQSKQESVAELLKESDSAENDIRKGFGGSDKDMIKSRLSEESEKEIIALVSNPKTVLSNIIFDFYLQLQLLENFRILNRIAAQKIIKKFKKAKGYEIRIVTAEILVTKQDIPKQLLSDLESLYLKFYAKSDLSDRKKMLEKLKVPVLKVDHAAIWIAGIFTGMAIPILVLPVAQLIEMEPTISQKFLIQIFAGLRYDKINQYPDFVSLPFFLVFTCIAR